MHFRNLDLNLLVALEALLEEKNITRAGKRLHLTQSAMSGALARLREYFGDELLVQVGRKMLPTPLGESLIEPVHSALLNIQAAIATKTAFDPGTSKRQFRLMMSDYVATVLMSAAMPSIERVAPHIRIEVLSNDVDSPADELDRASIDFLIMPEQYLVKDHPSERLFEDIYTCIGFRDNPLLPTGDQMSLEEYLALGHVVAQFGTSRGVMYDEWLMERMGLERRVEVVVMNFASIFPAIVGTHRIATTHRRLAQYYAQYLPLRLFDLPLEAPPLVESVKWHRHFDADPGTLWMRRMLRDAAETLDNRFGPTTSPQWAVAHRRGR